jgi:hydrogenase maturation protease
VYAVRRSRFQRTNENRGNRSFFDAWTLLTVISYQLSVISFMEEIGKICNALLYEGYALFPYRKNALKNQKRFNFGVLSPKNWSQHQINEYYFQQIEILVLAENDVKLSFSTRFLKLSNDAEWQTAEERKIENEFVLNDSKVIEYKQDNLSGRIIISTTKLRKNLFKVQFIFENQTDFSDIENLSREEILQYSFVSAHTIFGVENGKFISLLEPPKEFIEQTKSLLNIGVFPVLIGDKSKHHNILASPIILYDFPEIAENSFTDFFDGLEIDELMILNLLALTDEEKRQIAETDERTRQILEKIANLKTEDLMKLHAHLR